MKDKMKIYVDVSCMVVRQGYLTGIQRVVSEIVCRLIESGADIVLLNKSGGFSGFSFQVIHNDKFVALYMYGSNIYEEMFSLEFINVDEFRQNSMFLDIDSSGWSYSVNRQMLYYKLKNQNVKIVANVYDIVPITYPQFTHEETLYRYMGYFGAVLKYADLIITNTKTVYTEIEKTAEKIGIKAPPNLVMPLGSSFGRTENAHIRSNIKRLAEKKYVLIVGTLEPRKNHKMLLDAFDEHLFRDGLYLVFAGRWGWRCEDLQSRVRGHMQLGRKFFHIRDASDGEMQYLYKNSFAVACPSFEEGFGLPLIEGLLHGTPVFASDIPVFREVGREFCEYFELDNPESFAVLVRRFLNDNAAYAKFKEKVKTFVPYTWDQAKDAAISAIRIFQEPSDITPMVPKQMVILSARPRDLLSTIPYIDHMMPFITELVVCCPQKCSDELKSGYKGRLALKIVTDEELLDGKPLPKDHSIRNYFLRCLAVESGKLDEVFIMSDDDYRPLRNIDISVYINDEKYSAFYCYDLREWKGDVSSFSSFDISMRKSADWLFENRMPTLQYSSHMPQIIDSRIFRRMLEAYPDLPQSGLEEWCTYFNYAAKYYTAIMDIKPYVTLGWPGNPSDWELYVNPTEYLFENYYEQLYEEGQIFAGFSKIWTENTVHENITKVSRFAFHMAEHNRCRALIRGYAETYNALMREEPSIVVDCTDPKKPKIFTPPIIILPASQVAEQWMRIPIALAYEHTTTFECSLASFFCDTSSRILKSGYTLSFKLDGSLFDIELPMRIWSTKGRFMLSLAFRIKETDILATASILAEFV